MCYHFYSRLSANDFFQGSLPHPILGSCFLARPGPQGGRRGKLSALFLGSFFLLVLIDWTGPRLFDFSTSFLFVSPSLFKSNQWLSMGRFTWTWKEKELSFQLRVTRIFCSSSPASLPQYVSNSTSNINTIAESAASSSWLTCIMHTSSVSHCRLIQSSLFP